MITTVSIIGSGKVAQYFTKKLFDCGYSINSVFSRNIENAKILAEKVNAKAVDKLSSILSADLFLFSVKDDAYKQIITSFINTKSICVHTSGSLDMNILEKLSNNYGVLYPFQTFSGKDTDYLKNIPLCVESSNFHTENILVKIADELSSIVYSLDSQKRSYLHLAGVFACNFTNAMYVIAQQILQQNDMDFNIALPLIDETAQKISTIYPINAQTGPAARNDINIINKHIEMIQNKDWKDLYLLISKIIQKQQLNEKL